MTIRFPASLVVVLGCSLLAFTADAQEAASPDPADDGYLTGWHIVRPTDTLEGITLQYLGTHIYWEQNWRLNTDVKNPHLIFPGQRLQVILKVGEAVPTAQLSRLAGKVEERPAPIPWREAGEDDILLERDGVQTYDKSSTELKFQDGTTVTLTENSTVFVRRAGIELIGQDRKSVEILEGQADIQAELDQGSLAQVEIVIAGSVATAKASAEGKTQTRARMVDDESSAFMVYAGAASVAAAGESVPLEAGMGTSVTEGAPPAPPEKLLGAPAVTGPVDGAEIEFGLPRFEWTAVEGAESYTLEVCRDPTCGELVERAVNIEETYWEPEELATGDMFWRVAPVSATGLDGFSSPATRFASLGRIEGTPPDLTVDIKGRKVRRGDRLIGDKDLRFEVTLDDDDSGPDRYETFLNGEKVANDAIEGDWSDGAYEATVVGYDGAGNKAEFSVDLEVDTEGPVVEWRHLSEATLAKLRKGYDKTSGNYRLEWSVDGIRWRRVAPKGAPGSGRQGKDPYALNAATVRSDHPFIVVRAIADGALDESAPVALTAGEAILIKAVDERSGTAVLELRVDESDVDGSRLFVVATDYLGNQTTKIWPLGS